MNKAAANIVLHFLAFLLLLNPSHACATDFEVFDGQVYNGKYYPRIDTIEWSDSPNELTHMEFHIFSKGKPIKLSFALDTKTGKKVMQVNYDITERDEHLCRRVLAPQHFKDGFLVYRDNTDPDFDNVLVSMLPLAPKPGRELVKGNLYLACAEPKPDEGSPVASDSSAGGRLPAGGRGAAAGGGPAFGAGGGAAFGGTGAMAADGQGGVSDQVRTKSDPGALKKTGAAVPFGDW